MSASTTAIPISTPSNNHQLTLDSNPNQDTRKRVVTLTRKKVSPEINGTGTGTPSTGKAMILSSRDIIHTTHGEALLPKDSSPQTVPSQVRKKKPATKSRSNLQIIMNLLVKLCTFVMFVYWVGTGLWNWYEGKPIIGTRTPEKRLDMLEASLKKTSTMLQMQVDIIDKKIGSEIDKTRQNLLHEIQDTSSLLQTEIKKLEGRNDKIDQLFSEFTESGFISKKEFEDFIEEFKNSKTGDSNDDYSYLDEIRLFAKQMVEREIEKHSADGLGMVDYALASGGARIIRHSEPFSSEKGGWLTKSKVSQVANKMLEPSFGEPGQCFPLKGNSGFVEIRLRGEIVPQAFTIEHVAKSVAYDRSSAPKSVRIMGWYKGDGADQDDSEQSVFVLADITYDLSAPNAQTFSVNKGEGEDDVKVVINMVRFEFSSNHGNDAVTCIYRFRVHGYEPGSPNMIALEG